jgi:protein-S-isoprenylcysteine O-methyltransferase Ste14
MGFVHARLITILWLLWCFYWFAASAWSKPTLRQETNASRAMHTIPLVIAVALFLVSPRAVGWLGTRFLPKTEALFWLGTLMVAAGLGWSVWARAYLGGNWSAAVTLKRDHELVRMGPYRFTRHPIYTGILTAFAGNAIALGEWRGLIALALVLLAFRRKIVVEERFMSAQFPEYARYRLEVPALFPRLLRHDAGA